MKKYYSIIILILSFFIVFSVQSVLSRPELIGIIEYSPEYLLAWNQGSVANETYLNRSSGLVQIANALDRTDDAVYRYGFARKTGSTYTTYSLNTLPGNESYGTDFTNYYYASSYKNESILSSWFHLTRNNSQNTYDDYVKVEYSFITKNAIIGGYYFANQITQLDIGSDGKHETIVIYHANGSSTWMWNETGTYTHQNITEISINGAEYSFHLIFPKGVIAVYNHSGTATNGDWSFYEYLGVVPARTLIKTSHYWIDATCTTTCNVGCSVLAPVTNASVVTYQQGKGVDIRCQWTYGGFACGSGSCNITPDCTLSLTQQKINKNNYQITQTERDYAIKCFNSTCYKTNPVANVPYIWRLIASKVYNNEYGCHLGILQSVNLSVSWTSIVANWTTTKQGINVSLVSPATGSNYAQNNVMFNVTATNLTVDNCSIYFNTTKNLTRTGNISFNISFDQNQSLTWQAYCCYSNNCNWNWNGNRTTRIDQYYNSIQWTPANWTDLACRDWVILGSNTTGSRVVDTQKYFVNNSVKAVVARNASHNFTLQTLGRYLWTVETCAGSQCRNVTGIRWFHAQDNYHTTTQWTPLDNANLRSQNWALLGANVTGNCTPNNMTYFVNSTNVANVAVNATYNYTIPAYGIYNWLTQTCIIGFCSNISIFNFYTQYYPPATSARQNMKYYIIDRSEVYCGILR